MDAHRLEGAGRRVLLVVRLVAQCPAHHAGELAGGGERARRHDGARDAARLALLAIVIEHVGDRRLVGGVEEIGGALALAAHPHIERAVMHEGKAAFLPVELHRGDADVHHHRIDLRHADAGERGAHRGEALGMEHETALVSRCHRLACRDGIGIPVEGVHVCARLEKGTAVAARAEGCIDDRHARRRADRGDHLVEQHGDVGRLRRHAAPPFRAAAISLAQLACAPFHAASMRASSSGFQTKKKSPAPWK